MTRPTSDRAREALFSHLEASRLPDSSWSGVSILDLFAGSGSIGLEALSRGAEHATFIDSGRAAISAIRENINALETVGRATVIQGAVPRALYNLQRGYQLIFADPPYEASIFKDLGTVLADCADRASHTHAILERRRGDMPPELAPWTLDHELRCSESTFYIYNLPPLED